MTVTPLSGRRRERGWRRGERRREAVDEMFLLCSTARDTDPSVNQSFTFACIQTLFRYQALSSFPSYYTVCPSPLHLHCTLMFTEPLQGVMRRSGHGRQPAAELRQTANSVLCFLFSGLSCGLLTTMSQHTASHTNRRRACVF